MSASRVLGAVGCFCVAVAWAAAGEMHVLATRRARIAIVDAEKAHFTAELEQRFSERLGAAMTVATRPGNAPQLEHVSAREASARVRQGTCDAILFVGAERPGTLRSLDASTLAGLCGHVLAPTPVYLIVPNGDPERKRVLGQVFAAAIRDVPNGERVAALE